MTPDDIDKAKDQFSMHQDNLMWSRAQTLIAVQTAVLAGGYGITEAAIGASVLVLGILLTVAIWLLFERDRAHRESAFERVRPHLQPDESKFRWFEKVKGCFVMRTIFILTLVADFALLCYVACKAICW